MRKKFKTKKKIKVNLIIILIIIFFLISIVLNNIKIPMPKVLFIENILKTTNKYSFKNIENKNFIENIFEYIKNDFLNTPINLLNSELKVNKQNKKNNNFVYMKPQSPLIYIYNSHQGEEYSIEYLEDYNITPNVLMASNMLKDKLNNIGIQSIIEKNDFLNYMKEHNLKHADSYKVSRNFLLNIINNYSTIELFIDLHRDAAPHDITTTIINNKKCAKVLFVIGLENKNYKENLAVVTHINNLILKKYPTLTRGIMKKEGYGVNGIYNQDLAYNVLLLEVGGNENNIDEINNTLDLISEIIGEYLNEKKQVN